MSRSAEDLLPRTRTRERSMLGLVLVAAGALWFLSETNLLHVAGRTVASAALVCIGGGLIATHRVGRRRWPILVGGILALSLLGNSASASFHSRFGGGFGAGTFAPTHLADVHSSYQTGFGALRLDLSKVTFAPDQTKTIHVNVGFGALNVTVPAGVALRVQATDSAGAVNVLGHHLGGGVDVNQDWRSQDWNQSGRPRLVLDLEAGAGAINVDQAS